MRAELRALGALAVAAGTLSAGPAEAEAEAETKAEAETGTSYAVGLSAGWLRRNEYGDRERSALAPELVGLAYVETDSQRLFFRPGVRLGYVGLSPAEMPSSLRYLERDATLAAELGAVYDGVVIPAASIGAGLTLRRLELAVDPPIAAEEEPLSRWELLPSAYGQLAAGIPFARGAFVVEPFVRFEVMAGDDRAGWRYGVDLTLALP